MDAELHRIAWVRGVDRCAQYFVICEVVSHIMAHASGK